MRKFLTGAAVFVAIIAIGLFAALNIGPPLHPPSDISDLITSPESPIIITDVSDLEDKVIIEKDLAVVVRDGTRLSANLYRPEAPGRYPVVMAITAYHKDEGPNQYPEHLRNHVRPEYNLGRFEISPWTPWEGPDPAYWVQQGYAVVVLDARGYGLSEGKGGILSMQDRQDFHDAIRWAGTQAWSNGNVGLTGVSYLAIAQWVAGANAPEHLKAIMPWEGQSDPLREVNFHGGIPETKFTSFWGTRIRSKANETDLPPHLIMEYARTRPLVMKRSMERSSAGISLEDITVPALICASWSDHGMHTRGSFEGFKQISSEQKWIFNHGRSKWDVYYSPEALEVQTAFFDHFLKEEENGFDQCPSLRIEVRDDLERFTVREEEAWPLPSSVYTKFFLDAASGHLTEVRPETESLVRYDALEGNAAFRMTFDEETELTGNMKLQLWVEAETARDMDLFIAVKKYDTQGDEVTFYGKAGYMHHPVALGWMRASFRELDPERSTPEQPVQAFQRKLPLEPGEIVPLEIEVLPSGTRFFGGETLEVSIQGHPHFEHHALGYESTINRGAHIIHTGGQYDSHLLVPVIPNNR